MNQRFIQRHLYSRSPLSYLLYPLSLLYGGIQNLRRTFCRPKDIPGAPTIIGIGNIVSGGSGKTPFTIFLANHLKNQGKHPAICLRGYRGGFEHDNRIISTFDEILPEAKDAGDEARMLAEKLPGVPIAVGANRRLSIGMLMKRMPEIDCILLDDSFQHLKVKKDLMFVVFSATGGIGNGFVLPAGILREPFSALRHADCVVINGRGWELPGNPWSKPVIHGDYVIDKFYRTDGEAVSIDEIKRSKILLLSGIGNPSSFEKTVRQSGIGFVDHLKYGDHYDYAQPSFLTDLRRKLKLTGCDTILTTEKDFSKLKGLDLADVPIVVMAVRFEVGEIELLNTLLPMDFQR